LWIEMAVKKFSDGRLCWHSLEAWSISGFG
jgi:hypothetical protein